MSSAAPRRIVIPIIAGLGNSLMAMPMVRQMKLAWPEAKITILARSGAMGEPFRRMPEVDEVLITGVGIKALWNAVRFSRARKPDLYLIPFPSNRWHYSILALTSGAKRRLLHRYPAGYWRALQFTSERIDAMQGIHDVIQNLRLLKPLGIEPDETDSPRFPIHQADRDKAEALLQSAGVPSGATGYIAIHAGSGSYTVIAHAKRWPSENYAELITKLRREIGRPVLLLEGPDEKGVSESIIEHLTADERAMQPPLYVLKLSGPLGEAAAVLDRAELYVGSDSGLAHLAAATGKRAVTIFAPADPDRVCPHGSRDLVVQTPATCSPCFTYPFKTPYTDSKCKEPFCVKQVTVDRVLEAARRGVTPRVSLTVGGAS